MNTKVLMVVKSDVVHDSRVRREAQALVSAGYEVVIIGDAGGATETIDGAIVHYVRATGEATPGATSSPRPRWQLPLRWLLLPEHRVRAERQFAQGVRRVAANLGSFDIVHAHDFSAVPVAVELAAKWQAKVVYDAHEWWRGRARHGRPEPLRRWRLARREDRLLQQVDQVVTVSPELAQRLEQCSGVSPVVVRNSFPVRPTKLPATPTGLVYAGRISRGRDLETLFGAVDNLPVALELIGAADGSIPLPGQVHCHSQGPLAAVDDLIQRSGLVVVPLKQGPANHDVALPNKFFHAMACGAPVVAADFPALRRIVTEHQVGCLFTSGDQASFLVAVETAVAKYDELRANVARAQPQLVWPVDAAVLVEAYTGLRN